MDSTFTTLTHGCHGCATGWTRSGEEPILLEAGSPSGGPSFTAGRPSSMGNHDQNPYNSRRAEGPRNYRVKLSRYGSHPAGDTRSSPLTIYIQATSSMQARMNAEGSYPGYSVTDVMEA
jgi:hypothetical protein